MDEWCWSIRVLIVHIFRMPLAEHRQRAIKSSRAKHKRRYNLRSFLNQPRCTSLKLSSSSRGPYEKYEIVTKNQWCSRRNFFHLCSLLLIRKKKKGKNGYELQSVNWRGIFNFNIGYYCFFFSLEEITKRKQSENIAYIVELWNNIQMDI